MVFAPTPRLTDLALLADGYASFTAVRAVTEVSDVDLSGLGSPEG